MAEKIAELVPTSNGCSIVLKSNSFSNDLMVSTGLDLTFFDPNGSTELKRVTLKPEEIGFDNNGFSAPLPPEINNELAQKVNSFGGKFKVKALEYDPVSSKTVGDPAYFDASVTGTLKVIQDYVKKEGESINAATFIEKKEPTFTEDKATVDEIKSSDEVLNEAATATTTTVATKSSGKGKILAIIGAIIMLLFILGLLALFLAGFFGGSKDNSSNANEPTPKEQTEEAMIIQQKMTMLQLRITLNQITQPQITAHLIILLSLKTMNRLKQNLMQLTTQLQQLLQAQDLQFVSSLQILITS